jgi:nitrogen-specific signal transduction histidine kinase
VRQARHGEELARQLHQSQKLETIGRLAGGIAHDFNNLLTIISGYSELLAASPHTAPAMRESLVQVCQAAGRAAQLTGQLLAFSRQRSATPVLVDVNRLVRRECEMLRRIVDEDIAFITQLAPELPEIRGDAGRLAQVVMNLVLNARDAMPSGGQLAVRTTAVCVRAHDPDHPAVTEQGTYVRLSVDDTGCGMTPEECEHVFEPFYTTKGAGLGTGLGMTTVRSIVDESGGIIALTSTVGVGTSVQVYLPAATPAPLAVSGANGGPAMPGGRETILVVEDDAPVRTLTETVLSDHGYTVLSAVDGDDAVRQLDRAPLAVQLIVSDVVMPHRNGRAVVAHAQRLNPVIRALYLSGHTEDAIVRQGIMRDDVRFLQKPFTPAVLLRAVREALDA